MHTSPTPHKSDKIAWKIINNPPPNTPLINFLVGKLPTISHTIIGANETGNDRAYLKKLFASINIHSQPHIHSHCIPHSPNSSSNLPKPLSITYLDQHSKNTVIRSLHLLKNSPFQVRFCEPLNNSQLIARKVSISTINHLNSLHPIPNFNYVVRGTKNIHIALISCVPPDIVIYQPPTNTSPLISPSPNTPLSFPSLPFTHTIPLPYPQLTTLHPTLFPLMMLLSTHALFAIKSLL